jgi:hypothetical protein
MDQRVAVAVRIRPVVTGGVSAMHQQEQFEPIAASRLGDVGVQLQEHKLDEACRSCSFQFDYVFDSDSTQLEVYEDAVVDLIDGALQLGSNATILAYGQTGSGKTHTMLGDVRPNPLDDQLLTPHSGIFLRVLNDLLSYRERRAEKSHVVIGLSCVEIYNEKVRDLFGGLRPEDPPPQLKAVMVEDLVLLPNLIVKEVSSLQSVFNELQLAIHRRQSRATTANASSSRSHCLFTVDVLQRDASAERPTIEVLQSIYANIGKSRSAQSQSPTPQGAGANGAPVFKGTLIPMTDGGPPVYACKIVIADLAGSEKIRNSGVTGEGLAEATSINSSLTALGNVVHALHDGKLASYRDSNLTRLLKPSFNQPSARVLLLAQIAPTQLTYEESMSTLHFANKVKAMKMVSDPGVETDRLPFEYLVSAKAYLTLCGELAVWSASTGCRPSLRLVGASLRTRRPYWCSAPDAPKGAKDRLAALMGAGAGDKYRALRQQAEEEQREDDRRFEQSLVTLEKHRVAQAVQIFQDSKKKLQDKVVKAQRQAADVRMDHVIVAQTADRETLAALEENEFNRVEEAKLHDLQTLVRSAETELRQVESIAAPKPTQRAAESTAEADARMQDDEKYAVACWTHCNGRRMLNQALETRDVQMAYLIAASNRVRVSEWALRNKVPLEQQRQAMTQKDALAKNVSDASF